MWSAWKGSLVTGMIAVWKDVTGKGEGKEEESQEGSVGNRCKSSYISFCQDRTPESRLVRCREFKKGKLAGPNTTVPILPSASSVIRQSSTFFTPRAASLSLSFIATGRRAPVRARIASARQRLDGCFRTAVVLCKWDQPLFSPAGDEACPTGSRVESGTAGSFTCRCL